MVASSISTECELLPSAARQSSCLCQPEVIRGPVKPLYCGIREWLTGGWHDVTDSDRLTLSASDFILCGTYCRQVHDDCGFDLKRLKGIFFLYFSSTWSWKELLRNYFSVPPVIVLIALWYSFLLIFHPHSLIFHNNGAKPFCYRSIIFWSVQKSHKSAGRVWASVRRLIEESVKTWSHGASTAPLLTTVPPLTPPLVLLRGPAMGNASQ